MIYDFDTGYVPTDRSQYLASDEYREGWLCDLEQLELEDPMFGIRSAMRFLELPDLKPWYELHALVIAAACLVRSNAPINTINKAIASVRKFAAENPESAEHVDFALWVGLALNAIEEYMNSPILETKESPVQDETLDDMFYGPVVSFLVDGSPRPALKPAFVDPQPPKNVPVLATLE